jgi:hypothetical protein
VSIYYNISEFCWKGKTIKIAVQIGGFRCKILMASTNGTYANDISLRLYCSFLEISVMLIAASLMVEPYSLSNEFDISKVC